MEDNPSDANVADDRILALFVDGENISHQQIEDIVNESSKFGQLYMKRVYGNWQSPEMQGWKEKIQDNALLPIQVFPNITGKNAVDSSLIIDVMDILHDGIVNGFCIASSDSDYTSLALKVKEHGKFVLGLGRQSTHKSFTKACTRFIHLENLSDKASNDAKGSKKTKKSKEKDDTQKKYTTSKRELRKVLLAAYDEVETNDGFAYLSSIMEYLYKIDPSFDLRNYGVRQAIKAVGFFPKDFAIDRNNNSIIIKRIA